jgi:hypothetical protein
MRNVTELLRLPSPAPKPQSLAFDGETLWMGSRATQRIYALDAHAWTAREETAMDDVPWGIAVAGDELFVIHGDSGQSDRLVTPYVPGRGFDRNREFVAPDGTGSQLGWDGDLLYISQWYKKQIVAVDGTGQPLRTIAAPHGVCGQTIVDGRFYLVTTDDEENGDYWLTRIDARGDEPHAEDLAVIPFPARALSFDGERFWTNHREANEIVAFERPDA